MADVGVVLVGPTAGRMDTTGWSLPTVPVRPTAVPPPEVTHEQVVAAAESAFTGADADRFRQVDVAEVKLGLDLSTLWAAAAVHEIDLSILADWKAVLVVGWVDEPALVPLVRRLKAESRGERLGVLLGGRPSALEAGRVQACHTALADLVRTGAVARVFTAEEPGPLVEVAAERLRGASPSSPPAPVELRVGEWLDLEMPPLLGAAPIAFEALVRLDVGRATGLPRLVSLVAVHDVLAELLAADDPGLAVPPPMASSSAPASLPEPPDPAIVQGIRERLEEALAEVEFRGSELLVHQLSRRLRPIAKEIEEVLGAVTAVERARLSSLREFSAAGIEGTVRRLERTLQEVGQSFPSERLRGLALLLEGQSEGLDEEEEEIPLTAWRRVFGGLPSGVQASGTPGRRLARRLVRERFEDFRQLFAASAAEHLEALVDRARQVDAPPSTVEIRLLQQRALRVGEAVRSVLGVNRDRISAEAVAAWRTDALVRWCVPDPEDIYELLRAQYAGLPAMDRLREELTSLLRTPRVGEVEDRAFEPLVRDLMAEVAGLPERHTEVAYDDVLLRLLGDADPKALRGAWIDDPSRPVQLRWPEAPSPELASWLARTDLELVVVPGSGTAVVYHLPDPKLGLPDGPRRRAALVEHRLADLTLPPPRGDTVASLVGLAKSSTEVLVGLATGTLQLTGGGPAAVWQVRGTALPVPRLLPYEAVYALAHDHDGLARLTALNDEALAQLAQQPRAAEVVQRLVELSTLGPSASIRASLGLAGRLEPLVDGPLRTLLQARARAAVSAMVDAAPSSELEAWTQEPAERVLLDLRQLVP